VPSSLGWTVGTPLLDSQTSRPWTSLEQALDLHSTGYTTLVSAKATSSICDSIMIFLYVLHGLQDFFMDFVDVADNEAMRVDGFIS
jgi:hypothetical protein